MIKSKKISTTVFKFFGAACAFAFILFLVFINMLFPYKYTNIINKAAAQYNVDAVLIRAVIWTESKYRKDAVSHSGAVGLMQLLPSTAEFVAPAAGYANFTQEMLKDESVNINLGVFYLKYLLDKFKDEKTALMAYNAGEGTVSEWLNKGITEIPYTETADYINRISLAKKIYAFKSK